MKFASLKYHHKSMNLGDVVQSLAVEQHLPRIDMLLERDALGDLAESDKTLVVMNGWFTAAPDKWPPAAAVVPVFFGFHLVDIERVQKSLLGELSLEYFRKFEPIGCRDRKTQEILSGKGIDTFYSRCLTLTFPKRETEPVCSQVFVVDAKGIPLPAMVEKDAVYITHDIPPQTSDIKMRERAAELLRMYREKATLIITTKLHCALPCIAMGIPVVFFGNPDEYRVSLVKDIGVDIHQVPTRKQRRVYRASKTLQDCLAYIPYVNILAFILHWVVRKKLTIDQIDYFDACPVDIEDIKRDIMTSFRKKLDAILAKHSE